MTTLAKVGIASALGAIVIPTAVLSSGSVNSRSELWVEKPRFSLTSHGYRAKDQNELIDFDTKRNTVEGGLFSLGCHRLVFEGKNALRLSDYHRDNSGSWVEKSPVTDYFEESDQPVLGCSTASIMNSNWGKVYEYELALKRGDKGFSERITIWEGNATNKNPKAISQLVFYKKNHDEATKKANPWDNIQALQRSMDYTNFEIGNPKNKTWTDLTGIETSQEIDKPKYFSVWIESPNKSKGEGILDHLGVKIKSNGKLFSSIAKSTEKEEWVFKFFESNRVDFFTKIYANAGKIRPNYTSHIANEVSELKGSWQEVEEFCNSKKDEKDGGLTYSDAERLKYYCYTDKPKRR